LFFSAPRTPFKKKKAMSKTFHKKIDKNFNVSFSSIVLFYRVLGCFSAMGVENMTTKTLQQNVSKRFCKKIDPKKRLGVSRRARGRGEFEKISHRIVWPCHFFGF
jgi:hypothetical protein